MEGHLLMSHQELDRKSVLELVKGGHMTLIEAAKRLRLSYRQMLRVYKRYEAEGDAGLIHRRRGMRSNRGYDDTFREQVVDRYQTKYKKLELGPTLAAEKLAQEGFDVDHETLRRWLLDSGDWKRRRRRSTHRSRRERKAHFGELVQMDGSFHHWFVGLDRTDCLMDLIDDATGTKLALLDQEETTDAAMLSLRSWVERYGIPWALYTDKRSVYHTTREPTLEEQLADEAPMTAFGKACNKLGIEIIVAHSPQAKGRVERANGVFQDRFVKELSLHGIQTIGEANQLLQNGFLDELNAKFSVEPVEPVDYHRPIPDGLNLDDVFCYEDLRVIQNDWTVRHSNTYYQIHKENSPLPRPKNKVTVRTHLDGRIALLYKDNPLQFTRLTPRDYDQARTNRSQDGVPSLPNETSKRPRATKKWRPNCDRLIAKNKEPNG